MGEFPSGQRGQTVNLLSVTSVVRIHLPPPKIPNIRLDGRDFLILGGDKFGRRLQHAGGTLQPPWLFPQKKRVSLCAAGNPKSEERACENLGDCAWKRARMMRTWGCVEEGTLRTKVLLLNFWTWKNREIKRENFERHGRFFGRNAPVLNAKLSHIILEI